MKIYLLTEYIGVMDVVHLAAELAPIAKVGGLGDVLYGLSHAQATKGDSVEIILPKYAFLDLALLKKCEVVFDEFKVPYMGKSYPCKLWQGKLGGAFITLIESRDARGFFQREEIYGYPDDVCRFTYFCAAAIASLIKRKKRPNVIHLHDWQTALAALLIKEMPEISAKVLLTIHNFAYQGICEPKILDRIGVTGQYLQDEEHPKLINLLKGGIIYADWITTVSPTYAKEILTAQGGGALHKVLSRYKYKLSGVLNGIDFHFWNPEIDPHIPYHYCADNLENKAKNKAALCKYFSMEAKKETPLVAAIARLVPQKGPELIVHALDRTLELGGQFVLLGSTCDSKTQETFEALKDKYASSHQVHIELTYNEPLSHLVYAAADLFLVPSLFEPCGLTQMIAMRYGTVPLVRSTGGLIDTVFEGKNGFTFLPPTKNSIAKTLERALKMYRQNPRKWKQMVNVGMHTDFSWDKPAEAYDNLYKDLILCQTGVS